MPWPNLGKRAAKCFRSSVKRQSPKVNPHTTTQNQPPYPKKIIFGANLSEFGWRLTLISAPQKAVSRQNKCTENQNHSPQAKTGFGCRTLRGPHDSIYYTWNRIFQHINRFFRIQTDQEWFESSQGKIMAHSKILAHGEGCFGAGSDPKFAPLFHDAPHVGGKFRNFPHPCAIGFLMRAKICELALQIVGPH